MRPGQGRNHLTKTARTILEGAAFSEGGGPIQGAAHMTNGFSMLVKLYYQFLKKHYSFTKFMQIIGMA